MAHPNETTHNPETHCESCARDARRSDVISAAATAVSVGYDDESESMKKMRETAAKVLQKAFDEELLPKGFG